MGELSHQICPWGTTWLSLSIHQVSGWCDWFLFHKAWLLVSEDGLWLLAAYNMYFNLSSQLRMKSECRLSTHSLLSLLWSSFADWNVITNVQASNHLSIRIGATVTVLIAFFPCIVVVDGWMRLVCQKKFNIESKKSMRLNMMYSHLFLQDSTMSTPRRRVTSNPRKTLMTRVIFMSFLSV